jgi:hypothetical protein
MRLSRIWTDRLDEGRCAPEAAVEHHRAGVDQVDDPPLELCVVGRMAERSDIGVPVLGLHVLERLAMQV